MTNTNGSRWRYSRKVLDDLNESIDADYGRLVHLEVLHPTDEDRAAYHALAAKIREDLDERDRCRLALWRRTRRAS